MADIRKFLDQQGVSVLWNRIATDLKAESERAKAAEAANAAAAKKAQDEVDALETYVGAIPEGYEAQTNVIAYINKKAEETLNAANGGSSESAASVKAALDAYIAQNDPLVKANSDAIDAIEADYLVEADKTELSNAIGANTTEIARVNAVLVAALENEEAGLDSIKELASWIETHGTEAAGYSAAITALETKVDTGDMKVSEYVADAIAGQNLSQYATVDALNTEKGRIDGLVEKVDTGDQKVSEYVAAAVAALNIADYAKAADLLALAARVTTAEGKITTLEGNDADKETRIATMEAKVSKWDAAEANAKAHADGLNSAMDIRVLALEGIDHTKFETAGAAATALSEAKAYTDTEVAKIQSLSEAEIDAAIAAAVKPE
jgi:hypothetical protein